MTQKKIYFKQLPVENIDGKEEKVNCTQFVGNVLFNEADDVAEHDLGRKIYHEGDDGTELDENEVKIIRKFLPYFKYVLRSAIEKALATE